MLSYIIPAPFYDVGASYLELRELKKNSPDDQEKIERTALKVCFAARDCFQAILSFAIVTYVPIPIGSITCAMINLYNPTCITAALSSISGFGSIVIAIIAISNSSFVIIATSNSSFVELGIGIGVFAFSQLANKWYRMDVQKMWDKLEKPIVEPNPLTHLDQAKYNLKKATSTITAWA